MVSDNGECQGISIWGDYYGINDLDFEEGTISDAVIINYVELPSIIKSHIERLLNGGFQSKCCVANIVSCKVVDMLKCENISSGLVAKMLGVAINEVEDVYAGYCVFMWEQLQVIEKEFNIPCSELIAKEYNKANESNNKLAYLHSEIAEKYKKSE